MRRSGGIYGSRMDKTIVDITTEDGVADAYLVRPGGAGPFPGVLLYMDAFGLRPRIEEMAGRIAERGYAVLAPNLLYRGGCSSLVDLSRIFVPAFCEELFGAVMTMIRA